MSIAPRSRAFAVRLAFVIALLASAMGSASVAHAAIAPPTPAQLEVAVGLDKAAYLSGDLATAQAIVYRHPTAANYTYLWRARDTSNAILNETANATATYTYAIPRAYVGLIRFEATVDDQQGNVSVAVSVASVSIGVLALRLDRGDFLPGDTITASYNVLSNVIVNVTYDYEVRDSGGTLVTNGTTRNTSFRFTTPNPASRAYGFTVLARDGPNSTERTVTISQASGFLLSVTMDKASYLPGESIKAHLRVIPRTATVALPIQFRWTLTFLSISVSAITTTAEADLILVIPGELAAGEILVFATEASTVTFATQTVRIGTTAQNPLWSTEVGGIPLFAVLIALLSVLLLVAVFALWRRIGGRMPGPVGGKAAPPPPPEEPVRALPTSPMTVQCRHCGKPIDLTTSRRPIEVMCPSCGETQLVT